MFQVPQFQSYMALPTAQRVNQGGGPPMQQPNMAGMQPQQQNPMAQAGAAMELYKAVHPAQPPQNPMGDQQSQQQNPMAQPMTIGSGAGTQDTSASAMSGSPLMAQNDLLSQVGRPMVDAQGNPLDQNWMQQAGSWLGHQFS